LVVALAIICTSTYAQQVGKIDMKPEVMAGKKFNNTEKKIFIQHFYVNYQMMMSQSEIAKGGRQIGGGYRGSATASLSMAVKGVDLDQLQAMTDKFYQDYKTQLEDAGFKIMTADEVKSNEFFAKHDVYPGGTAAAGTVPGYVSTSPNGISFLQSKGGVFNPLGMPDSKNLGGVIVSRVYITVPFVESAESQASKALTKSVGGVAKIVLKPNLRVSPHESVAVGGDFKKPKSLDTRVSFAYKKSLKYQATFQAKLKKPIDIDGVFEEKKYKASQSGSVDHWGTSNGMFQMFNVDDKEMKNTQAVACEGDKYINGVREAVSTYLTSSVDTFLNNIK
jgi:hypothetical protein